MIVIGGQEYNIDLDDPAVYSRVLRAADKVETETNAEIASLAKEGADIARWPVQAYDRYRECFVAIFGEKDCKKILGDHESLTAATEAWNDLKDALFDYSVRVGNINTEREARRTSKYSADMIAKR